jgi:ppGpp synthetase/RelA/SpoT-type nucleotidyltranferase
MGDYIQIIVTIVGVISSGAIWKYMEARLKANTELKKHSNENNDTVQFRDDLKNRVKNMESLLDKAGKEKDELRQSVLDLTAEVHALRVEVDYLKKENERLKNK